MPEKEAGDGKETAEDTQGGSKGDGEVAEVAGWMQVSRQGVGNGW